MSTSQKRAALEELFFEGLLIARNSLCFTSQSIQQRHKSMAGTSSSEKKTTVAARAQPWRQCKGANRMAQELHFRGRELSGMVTQPGALAIRKSSRLAKLSSATSQLPKKSPSSRASRSKEPKHSKKPAVSRRKKRSSSSALPPSVKRATRAFQVVVFNRSENLGDHSMHQTPKSSSAHRQIRESEIRITQWTAPEASSIESNPTPSALEKSRNEENAIVMEQSNISRIKLSEDEIQELLES